MRTTLDTGLHVGGPCDGLIQPHNRRSMVLVPITDEAADEDHFAAYYPVKLRSIVYTYIIWSHATTSSIDTMRALVKSYRELTRAKQNA